MKFYSLLPIGGFPPPDLTVLREYPFGALRWRRYYPLKQYATGHCATGNLYALLAVLAKEPWMLEIDGVESEDLVPLDLVVVWVCTERLQVARHANREKLTLERVGRSFLEDLGVSWGQ